jgi:hypothetical protein
MRWPLRGCLEAMHRAKDFMGGRAIAPIFEKRENVVHPGRIIGKSKEPDTKKFLKVSAAIIAAFLAFGEIHILIYGPPSADHTQEDLHDAMPVEDAAAIVVRVKAPAPAAKPAVEPDRDGHWYPAAGNPPSTIKSAFAYAWSAGFRDPPTSRS